MSPRLKNELLFTSLTVIWIVALVVTCVYSHWYWFIAGWVTLAVITATTEYILHKRRIVAHWEHLPMGYNFLVHLFCPLLMFVMLPQVPKTVREWRDTPKPRCHNYSYPGCRKHG